MPSHFSIRCWYVIREDDLREGETRRLRRIANNELEKFRLHFSRCTNYDVAPLSTVNSLLTDTSIRWTPGVGSCAPFFSHFTVSKVSISRTLL